MDGTDLIEADEADLLSDEAVARLRAHPRFREAVETLAAGALADYEAQDSATRWLTNDLGRAGLYLAAAILDGTPDGLTAAALAHLAVQRAVSSRGRALSFVDYALSTGRMTMGPSPEPWTRRRLALAPGFMAPMRARIVGSLQAAAIVAPDVAEALPRLISDDIARRAAAAIGALLALRPELQRNPGGPLRRIFIARDAGTRLLQHLVVRQPPERSRLLVTAPLSRAELSRRYHVSRTHVNRLLAEAEAAGALIRVSPNQVTFSPAFSDEAEAYFAGVIQVNRTVARMLLAEAGSTQNPI